MKRLYTLKNVCHNTAYRICVKLTIREITVIITIFMKLFLLFYLQDPGIGNNATILADAERNSPGYSAAIYEKGVNHNVYVKDAEGNDLFGKVSDDFQRISA